MSIIYVNKQSKNTNEIVASEIVDKIKEKTTPKEFDAIYEIHNRDRIFELDQGGNAGCHALLRALFVKNYSLISYITALGGKDLLDLSSHSFSPISLAIYDKRLIKTLIVLGVNVNGLVQIDPDFSSPLGEALQYPVGNPNLQTAQLLRGYGARLTDAELGDSLLGDSQQSINFILEWDEAHRQEKEPVKKLLNATLVDSRFREVNKIIMEYVAPPSIEINYISIPRNVSGPLKEVIDEVLPSKSSIISEIVADYTQKSWVEISVID